MLKASKPSVKEVQSCSICAIFKNTLRIILFALVCLLANYVLFSFYKMDISPQFPAGFSSLINYKLPIEALQIGKEAHSDISKPCYSQRSQQILFLCKLGIESRCFMKETAEVIHLIVAVNILYTFEQGAMPYLFNYTMHFRGYLRSIGISDVLVEAIRTDFEQRYEVTHPNREPWEIQLVNNEFFYKRENLVNVAVNKMKNVDWEYIIWIDPHQIFLNSYWWDEAIVKFEKYNAVQLFQYLTLFRFGNITVNWKPYAFNEIASVVSDMNEEKLKIIGNAWGVRKEIFEQIGGLPDTCVSGCCDCAYALAGVNTPLENIDLTPHPSPKYFNIFLDWIINARKIFKQKHTYVRGGILHLEHERAFGYLVGMRYMNIYQDRFDYKSILKKDEDGMLKITDPELNTFFKIITIYTNGFIKQGKEKKY